MIKIFKRNRDISEPKEEFNYITFGDYKLTTEATHPLLNYRSLFPLYDKFLARICFDFNGLIIDVGANIGDTSIGIFERNKRAFIVGVEPEKQFSKSCIENIRSNNLQNRFLLVEKFITTQKGVFEIEKNETSSTGSLKKIADTGSSNSLTFLELMNCIPDNKKTSLDIIKIDTDGFDWDVLNSYAEMISVNPKNKFRFVFFEYQSYLNNIGFHDEGREERNEAYKRAIKKLKDIEYDKFCVFDNFGTHITTTNSVNEIVNLSNYISRSQKTNNHSTIFHLDILAFNEKDDNFVTRTLKDYVKL